MDQLRRHLTLRDGVLWFVLSTLVVLENVAMGDVGAPWWHAGYFGADWIADMIEPD